MELILNELEWADEMIARRDLGDRPVQTLRRVASYYYANKYGRRDIRRLLENFLISCDPTISLVKWSDTIDRVVKGVDKRRAVVIDGVDITQPEMDTIDGLTGARLKRLAFTLLCVSKYWDRVSKDNNGWVNTIDKDIMRMANLRISIKEQNLLFGRLIELGLLESAKRIDNLNTRVTFAKKGSTVMRITDFRNLGNQYMMYCGEPYFKCENCGITIPRSKNPHAGKQKYCPACAAMIKTKQSVDSVMRSRAAQSVTKE